MNYFVFPGTTIKTLASVKQKTLLCVQGQRCAKCGESFRGGAHFISNHLRTVLTVRGSVRTSVKVNSVAFVVITFLGSENWSQREEGESFFVVLSCLAFFQKSTHSVRISSRSVSRVLMGVIPLLTLCTKKHSATAECAGASDLIAPLSTAPSPKDQSSAMPKVHKYFLFSGTSSWNQRPDDGPPPCCLRKISSPSEFNSTQKCNLFPGNRNIKWDKFLHFKGHILWQKTEGCEQQDISCVLCLSRWRDLVGEPTGWWVLQTCPSLEFLFIIQSTASAPAQGEKGNSAFLGRFDLQSRSA